MQQGELKVVVAGSATQLWGPHPTLWGQAHRLTDELAVTIGPRYGACWQERRMAGLCFLLHQATTLHLVGLS